MKMWDWNPLHDERETVLEAAVVGTVWGSVLVSPVVAVAVVLL